MKFELNEKQIKKFEEWRNSKRKKTYTAAIGGAYTFSFTPTSIGVMVEASHADGDRIDLTEDL